MNLRMYERIEEIPGVEGWWNSSSHEIFDGVGAKLLEHGFTEDDVIDILDRLYYAAGLEFGG